MNFEEAGELIGRRVPGGMKLGLSRIEDMIEAPDLPGAGPAIGHVAGANGKTTVT